MLFFTTGNEKEKNYVISAEQAFNTYADAVWRLALTHLGAPHFADDILQEVFLRFLRKKPKFYDAEHCKAWLFRVTINLSNNLHKSTWNKKITELTEEFYVEMTEKSEVYYAVLKLDEKYRTVVHLHYYEGYSVQEIAEICKSNPATVKTRLFRAREQLKETLKGEEF